MNNVNPTHSGAWITFTYFNALAAVAMMLGGVFFLPIDLWIKGYLLMGLLMLVSSTIIVTKTIRDVEEAKKLVNKIEEAKTERLLASIGN